MMRTASINLNKRLGNPNTRFAFEHWLSLNNIDLVLVQEPWVRKRTNPVILCGFLDLGGTDSVRAWCKSNLCAPRLRIIEDNWLELHVGYFWLENVYLSAYSADDRRNFLESLRRHIHNLGDEPVLVMGDFNLAPRPQDGLVNGTPSEFTKDQERTALAALMTQCKMKDVSARTSESTMEGGEFTIERIIGASKSQFRCDLALLSEYVADLSTVRYDHSVRLGGTRFTDHSAIIVEMAVTLPELTTYKLDLFSESDDADIDSVIDVRAHRTAMGRVEPSSIAKMIVEEPDISPSGTRILDYGCGRGLDLKFYRDKGYEAEGWDPHADFGFNKLPSGRFDLVVCSFVMNVLPNRFERLVLLRDACRYLADSGLLILASR